MLKDFFNFLRPSQNIWTLSQYWTVWTFGYKNGNMTSPYYYVVFFRYWAAVDLFLTTNLPILFFLASLQPTHFFLYCSSYLDGRQILNWFQHTYLHTYMQWWIVNFCQNFCKILSFFQFFFHTCILNQNFEFYLEILRAN